MSTPRINIKVNQNGETVSRSLYFGMAAIEIFTQKSVAELAKLAKENPKTKLEDLQADPVKSFAYVVYAGLCNEADIREEARPTFAEAYEITDAILYEGIEMQTAVWNCFNDSRAHKALIERMRPESSPAEKKSAPAAEK